MLATAGALPPDDGRWAYEVKWDGVRALVSVAPDGVRLVSRNGNDVTGGYPELAQVEAPGPVLLDGEVVAFDAAGLPDFGLLQSRMHVRGPSPDLVRATPVTLLVFDVLHAGGRSLLDLPYDDRRSELEALGLQGPAWQVPPAFLADGADVAAATRAQGMEGVVAKRRGQPVPAGRRSDCWLKVKHVRRTSAVVVGWKPGDGGRAGRIGSLLLAVPEGRRLDLRRARGHRLQRRGAGDARRPAGAAAP
jgi:bifunctional non-homologous end joining protein LigD